MPLTTLVVVAAGRGDVRQGLELSTALEKFESVLVFALSPESLARYRLASSRLAEQVSPDELSTARAEGAAVTLPQAHDRGAAYARTVIARVGDDARPATSATSAASAELTPRETQILVQLASGATNKAIGTRLGMSPKRVMHHSVSIYRKLGVRGRGEATARAFRAGLVDARDDARDESRDDVG